MSPYDQALYLLASFGVIIAIVGLVLARRLDRLEAERRRDHPAE